MIDAFAPAGAAFIALNPLHAIPNRQPYNTSPYLPLCSLYRNFIYLDVERVPGLSCRTMHAAKRDRALLREPSLWNTSASRTSSCGAAPGIRTLSQASAGTFERFRGIRASRASCCTISPCSARSMNTSTAGIRTSGCGRTGRRSIAIHDPPPSQNSPKNIATMFGFSSFCSGRLTGSWRRRRLTRSRAGCAIGLYHDLALATDRFGADLWMNRRFYATGARVGAPPDELAPSGQDWGIPPA